MQVSARLERHAHEAKESQEQISVLQKELNGVQAHGMLEQQVYLDHVKRLENEGNKLHQHLAKALSEHSMARLVETNALKAEQNLQTNDHTACC